MLAFLAAGAHADSRAQKYYYEDITAPFFALDPARPGWYHSVRPASITSSFPAVKSTDTFRVFVLGGSIAGLLHYNDHQGEFAQALQAVLPSKKVEVLNCGMAGYESFREALIEQEILEYSPDLIVFLTGHNEGIASAPFPVWIMRAQERLSRFDAFRALVKSLHPEAAEAVRTDARADARDATFAKNLSDNIRHARERGVEVAVVVPPRNYREPAELGRTPYDVEFVPGWILFLKGDFAGARRAWKDSLAAPANVNTAESAHKAFTWGFIARAEEKLGLWNEARDSFDQAARFDRAAICGLTCQGIIRETTKKEGGFLVEADRLFRLLTAPRMPGLETFNDRMHWKPQFNCLMSSEIIAALRGQPRLGALPWDAARIKALGASCDKPGGSGTVDDDLRILGYVLMSLSWPDFNHLSTVSVFSLQFIRDNHPEWFKDVPVLMKKMVNPQTQVYGLTMAPDAVVLPRFYWHIGEVRLLEKDYPGAIADLSTALRLDPSLAWARLSLAVATGLSGDTKGGLELLRNAVARSAGTPAHDDLFASAVAAGKVLGFGSVDDLSVDDPAYWLVRASSATAAGRGADGLAALARARALSPRPEQRRRMADLYGELKAFAQAQALLEELVRAAPLDATLRLDRADLAARAGDAKSAREFLAQTRGLALDASQRHRMALIHQDLKDYADALTLLSALAKEKPDAAVLGDLGVCKVLAGRPDEAIPDLKEAIKLVPEGLAPYLTLAAIYAGRKDSAAELAVYDSAPVSGGEPALRGLLLKGRREAEARLKAAAPRSRQ